jgi:hypothetical protein
MLQKGLSLEFAGIRLACTEIDIGLVPFDDLVNWQINTA